jgi:hypothetical protein
MSKGVLLFAFNSPKYDYYKMAVFTAKRVNELLNLPVTVVTDKDSVTDPYTFDNTIFTTPNSNNKRDWGIWINKDRFKAFDFSPYDETILLDTDYLVNSNKLLKLFELPTDFCCHDTTSFLMQPDVGQELLSSYSFKTLWATVIKFKKTKRTEQIFNCLGMIQNNFSHYANMHGFIHSVYRNDYALTLATRIVNGHSENKMDIIPWNLIHVNHNRKVYKNDEKSFVILSEQTQRGKTRQEYVIVKDMDFHMLNKDNFLELI